MSGGILNSKITKAVAGTVAVAVVMMSLSAGTLSAEPVGKFTYRGQPEDLNGDTIHVSDTMVAMSEVFWTAASRDSTLINGEPPSIMFVIDNSGSMSGTTDRTGNRFNVTRFFLDTIRTKYPSAEVGLAVFGTRLWFDPTDSSRSTRYPFVSRFPFRRVIPQIYSNYRDSGAYVPLLKLDSVYANYGNLTGFKLLDTILRTQGATGNVTLRYVPTNGALDDNRTNITTGFDAVKSAMAVARASRCSQYVIFLSDGEANEPPGGTPPITWYFRDSVRNVPTTFTVFFPTPPATGVPASIQLMTQHIQVNGYDTSSVPDSGCTTRSAYYSCNATDLMPMLSTNIWNTIIYTKMALPGGISIGGATPSYRSGDTTYVFTSMFPLTGQITPFHIDLVYLFYQDNKYTGRTTLNINYNVLTMPHLSYLWTPPDSSLWTIKTWNRTLSFRYAAAPITAITETMDSIELYFTFDSGTAKYGYDNVQIDLYNKIAPIDHQLIPLTWVSNGVYSAKFKRQVSTAANPNEAPPVLQYRGDNDTIIAVFRNRESVTPKVPLPLDTLRKICGFRGVTLSLSLTDTTIRAGDTTRPMTANVAISGGGAVDPAILNSITWTQLPTKYPGDNLINTTGPSTRFTATLAYQPARPIVATLVLPGSGITLRDTALITVIPGAAFRLWIEADTLPPWTQLNPFGTMTFSGTRTLDSAWAVVRDRSNNFVRFSTNTIWYSANAAVATVANGIRTALGEGVVTKAAAVRDSTWVRATDVATNLRDSIRVVNTDVSYDQLIIMRYVGGVLVQIYQLYDTIPNPVTLYVRGHRVDGLGGTGGWVDVPGNWSLSTNLTGKTSTNPPSNVNLWTFAPVDTADSGTITVSLPGVESAFLYPVAFRAGAPNIIRIYPHYGMPDIAGNMPWPAIPVIADTITADEIDTLLYAKVFYQTVSSKYIWLPQYETDNTLGNQITWAPNRVRDTCVLPYGNHTTLRSRQVGTTTLTASLNSLSFSMNILVIGGAPDHLVIEASPTITSPYADAPLSQLTILPQDTIAYAYAVIRDHWGDYLSHSVYSLWSSTNAAVFAAIKGDSASGQGIAVRRANGGQALMIATDNVARPGYPMRDTVPVRLDSVYFQDMRIYVVYPAYNPNVDTITIRTDDSLTLYAEGQRSDDNTWEPVQVQWSKDVSLDTKTNPSGLASYSWTVIPNYIGTGRIRATLSQTIYSPSDSVWAIFIEGDPASVALYRALGNPAAVPAFPAIDTVAAGSTDLIFAKIFDRNSQWLSRFETDIPLSQSTISWAIQRVSGAGTDTLTVRTGRGTTFTPHTAYTLYQVTATFSQNGKTFTASAMIYVGPGAPDHIVIEPQAGQSTPLNGDNRAGQVLLRPSDTTNDRIYAVIRDQFGNFIDYSHNPSWWSDNITIVTAVNGTAWLQYGQGKVIRVLFDTGSTYARVRDLDYPNLRPDSVLVVLNSVPYDSLRITLRHPISQMDTVHIGGIFTMQSGTDTTFYVQAHRLNAGWENVNADWRYVATLDSKSATNLHGWLFAAVDTANPDGISGGGYGRITATYASLNAAITIRITRGVASSLVLYKKDLPPLVNGNDPKPNPPAFVTVAAGSNDTVSALIFDWRGVLLPNYMINPFQLNIGWTAISRTFGDNLSSSHLSNSTGFLNHFAPTRAYDTVLVIAALNLTMRDTMLVVVQSGPANHIVLEKTPNYDLHRPDPCDTLRILDNEQRGSVYAILRDQWDNVVSPAYATVSRDSVWSLYDSIGVNTPSGIIGEVQALRLGLTDMGKIAAWDVHNFGDSCVVILLPYRYPALRITDRNGTPYADVYTLTMNTNDSVAIYVQGQRSDNPSQWDFVEATWEIQPSIQPVLPGNNRYDYSFMVSPTDTGSGWIRVTRGNYDQTTPDTLSLRFTPGPPVRAVIHIITPPDQRIAGAVLQAVDSLYNADNMPIRSPSISIDTCAYHDTIGRGGLARPEPIMQVRFTTIGLDSASWPWGFGQQVFIRGVDTVLFRLYYAPVAPVSADSMHRISVRLLTGGDTLAAQSEPFVLLPAALASIVMESNGVPITDTVKLYYNDPSRQSVNIFTRGYDQFYNNLGFIPTDWSVNTPPDSLHPVAYGDSVTNVLYSTNDPSFTNKDEGGWIEAHDPTTPAISDRVPVYIFGPLITLDSAVTGDWTGNGLLDHMTLYFSRPVMLDPGYTFKGLNISYTYTGYPTVYFTPDSTSDSIVNNTGGPSAVWIIAFKEQQPRRNDNSRSLFPQTGWVPRVQIGVQQNAEGRAFIAAADITSLDGAGPVIWSVIESRPSASENDRKKDTVRVAFSEPVKRKSTQTDLRWDDPPSQMFYAWVRDTATGGFVRDAHCVDMFLVPTNINNQWKDPGHSIDGDTVTFLMSNGNDLNGRNYVNIDSVNKFVVDARNNLPNDNNQKVRVLVNAVESPLLVVPNPAAPYLGHPTEPPGKFNPVDNPNAPKMADPNGSGGVAIKFDFKTPERGVDIEFWLKIYDMVGNLVQMGYNKYYYSSMAAQQRDIGLNEGLMTSYLYWNGTNAEGMVVSPGVYRVVVYLHYWDEPGYSGLAKNYGDKKKVCKLGISSR